MIEEDKEIIKKVQDYVIDTNFRKAVRELRALVAKRGLEDDYDNKLISLLSRITTHDNKIIDFLYEGREEKVEAAQIRRAINHYTSLIEEDLEDGGGSGISLEESINKEIQLLEKSAADLIKRLEHLRNRSITVADPNMEFTIKESISEVEKELDDVRARIDKLKADLS